MKERCFADRKDGTCHALSYKNCEYCKFYTPRSKVKNNVFYRWSWENNYRFNLERIRNNIPMSSVMKKSD